jgi:putative membrane protein
MQGWLIRWGCNILAIILTAYIVPGFELTVWGAIVGSVFLGIINAVIRPLLVLLTLPLNVVSLGLFTFIINGIMLYITAATIKGFTIHGFWWAVLSALLLSLISAVVSYLVKDKMFKIR